MTEQQGIRLTDLKPGWVRHGGHGVTKDGKPVPMSWGVALGFICPCGCGEPTYIELKNPLSGSPLQNDREKLTRVGTDFETLSINEKIVTPCGWAGWLAQGLFVPLS